MKEIYRDRFLVVVNKPAGLICHPAGQNQGDTLVTRLRHFYGKQVRLMHRLDQNTSGVVLAAIDPLVVPHLYRQFEKRKVKKKYLALVSGPVVPEKNEICLPIAALPPESAIKVKRQATAKGSEARTRYRLLKSGKVSLLEVIPFGGRKHQIRVHLAFAGHPIIGDLLYRHAGLPFLWQYYCRRPFPWHNPLKGHGLHAYSLEIIHPKSGRHLVFCASLPDDWKHCL